MYDAFQWIDSLFICLFVSFSQYPERTRECRKMCLHAVNSSSKGHKLASDSALPLFILDGVGYSRFILNVQILNRTENKLSFMLTRALVEDG